ncbi:uncharacterized protein LOC107225604 [Neodiprion lecontei]|uniref:Uncharacterized protein LOC107225604 n=1 Tax=Neodiprion lecontei TaxID=441921 RepID=A0A6J0C4Y7_NEOLC|nr:uncharacterized protein LOC107225604 [Neodiprion lecontei]
MWPLLVVVALVDASTSRTESLNFKNSRSGIPLRLNDLNMNLNDMLRKSETDPLDKYESALAAVPLTDDAIGGNGMQYQGDEEPFDKLSIFNDLRENQLGGNADDRISPNDGEDDNELDQLSAYLTQLLQEPGGWEPPVFVIEEPAIEWESPGVLDDLPDGLEALPTPWKRSRYYRRYPWKRQNSRSHYVNDSSRYLCTPTREDVFQLLVALHDARQGNKSRTVNFCKRRRPAGTVFTNIRFLGRKK